MSEDTAAASFQLEEATIRAWSALSPHLTAPRHVEPLQRARARGTRAKGKRTAVLRLEGAGANGTDVIAKRTRTAKAHLERIAYEEVLPHVSLPKLRYYGSTEDEDGEFCWLFLEDAAGDPFTFLSEENQSLAAGWLGVLHLTAARLDLQRRLPTRGPNVYLEELRSTRDTIRQNLGNPVLSADDLLVLNGILSQYDLLESQWSRVEDFCARMPQTLVHGHLEKRNLRLRQADSHPALLVFDWETVCWGTPAIDFAQWAQDADSRPVSTYLSIVEPLWPRLDARDVSHVGQIGSLFRLILSIGGAHYGLVYDDWAAQGHEVAGDYARWCMHDLRAFHARLDDSMKALSSEMKRNG